MARLRRVDPSGPGITRVRRGRGWEYRDPEGRRIEEQEVIERIRDLAIPPAWKQVWICPYPTGHLQATGTDVAGRKQYLYHPEWRERRDQEKFDEMVAFARTLPALRARVHRDLSLEGFARERVLACAVRLLDRGFFRIGSEGYAEQNETYGLATIRKSHVRVDGGRLTFDYIAKGRTRRVQTVLDPEVAPVVEALRRRRGGGPDLLAYKEGGRWVDVRSAEVNAYVKEVSGGDFSAKDFRTWNATVLAALGLAVSGPAAGSRTARKRAINRAVREVADYLGNTPAVARSSYIDPRVFDRFDSGLTVGGALAEVGAAEAAGEPAIQGPIEEAVLDLISGHEESESLERVA
jgi:DNA topoisomerase I